METIQKISEIIYDITGKRIGSSETNLLSSNLEISPSNLIYIVDKIEQEYRIEVYPLFENCDYSIFTIKNISKYIDGNNNNN